MAALRNQVLTLAAVAWWAALAACAGQAELHQHSGDSNPLDTHDAGVVLFDDFESGDGKVYQALSGDPRLSIAQDEGVGGGLALRATYVGGEMGSERLVKAIPLGVTGRDFTLSYDVKFASGFQFVWGGKLHGLGPSDPVTGGEAVRADGWSARVMWRQGGRAETYVYHQEQPRRFGEAGRIVRPFSFQRGRYHAVSLHVKLNEPAGAANGFARLYVDGELVDANEGLRFRSTAIGASLISRLLFSTFHGGNDPSWAPRTPSGEYANVHAYFDNFAVHSGERIRTLPRS